MRYLSRRRPRSCWPASGSCCTNGWRERWRTAGDETLAAEAAGHWAAACRTGEEPRARLTAAGAAEHMFAYADAATHWQRAIELCQTEPEMCRDDRVEVPRLYIRGTTRGWRLGSWLTQVRRNVAVEDGAGRRDRS